MRAQRFAVEAQYDDNGHDTNRWYEIAQYEDHADASCHEAKIAATDDLTPWPSKTVVVSTRIRQFTKTSTGF